MLSIETPSFRFVSEPEKPFLGSGRGACWFMLNDMKKREGPLAPKIYSYSETIHKLICHFSEHGEVFHVTIAKVSVMFDLYFQPFEASLIPVRGTHRGMQ